MVQMGQRAIGDREAQGGDVVAFGAPGEREPEVRELLALVAEATGVAPRLLLHPSRCGADVAEARQLAMYLMHVILQRSYNEIGRSFGRDRTTVAHACARIEDKREDNRFEQVVAGLEERLGASLGEKEQRRVAC